MDPTTPNARATPPLCVAFHWSSAGSVALELRDAVSDGSTRMPLGTELGFRVAPGRACVGWFDFVEKRTRPCPRGNAVGSTYQCNECREGEGYTPCMLCKGFACPKLAPAVRELCDSPHRLYLACFGEAWIKVGTSARVRCMQRVLEQGPLAVAFVAEAEGPAIKRMEEMLAQSGFVTRVTRSTKRRLLSSTMAEHEARDRVLRAAADATAIFTTEYRARCRAPKLVDRPELARRADGIGAVEDLRVADDVEVFGSVIAVRGSFALLRTDAGVRALDLTSLRGRRLDFTASPTPRRRDVQMSLF